MEVGDLVILCCMGLIGLFMLSLLAVLWHEWWTVYRAKKPKGWPPSSAPFGTVHDFRGNP